jgi:hypothetical protein
MMKVDLLLLALSLLIGIAIAQSTLNPNVLTLPKEARLERAFLQWYADYQGKNQ